jgi:hypothetical protein
MLAAASLRAGRELAVLPVATLSSEESNATGWGSAAGKDPSNDRSG